MIHTVLHWIIQRVVLRLVRLLMDRLMGKSSLYPTPEGGTDYLPMGNPRITQTQP